MHKQILTTATAFVLSWALFSCSGSGTTSESGPDSVANAATGTGTGNTATAAGTDSMATTNAATNGPAASKNVVENAVASPDHTVLVQAVQAAGLDGTLSGAGPFTVFAPTNGAFAKLPAGTVDNLLKQENKNQLTKILTYHVVPGSIQSAALKDGQKVKTVQGEELTVRIKDGKVMINDATVSAADIQSSNGVIHVIDGVLMPKK
jgi:uncharacterized surface protein with fasciclin (FAS1) repeats